MAWSLSKRVQDLASTSALSCVGVGARGEGEGGEGEGRRSMLQRERVREKQARLGAMAES